MKHALQTNHSDSNFANVRDNTLNGILKYRNQPVFWQYTAQKMKFSIIDFFIKCDQIHSFLQIWSHLLKKSLMENFIFCAVRKEKTKSASVFTFNQITKEDVMKEITDLRISKASQENKNN